MAALAAPNNPAAAQAIANESKSQAVGAMQAGLCSCSRCIAVCAPCPHMMRSSPAALLYSSIECAQAGRFIFSC